MQLLLMKRGGRVIYGGKLGTNSQIMIDYFQVFLRLLLFSSSFRSFFELQSSHSSLSMRLGPAEYTK